MSLHFFVRFAPLAGSHAQFREELLRVVEASRSEPGCYAIHAFESLQEPPVFGIHSEWADEAAFELHAGMPHTVRFLQAAEKLLPEPVQGLRTRAIGGGRGIAAPRPVDLS